MHVLTRALVVLIVIGAAAAVLVRRDEWGAAFSYAPEATLLVLGGVLGFLVAFSRRFSETPPDPPLSTLAPADATSTPAASEAGDQRALLAFARHLLDATSQGQVQSAVESHLPMMANGRKVWIATDRRQQPANQHAAQQFQHASVLTDEIQEWTTFALRLEDERLGLLGVQSPGGLPTEVRQRIQSVVPLIAQAVKSAQEVETFREASVVDLLTGAATRREGLNRLQAEVKRAQRTGSTMAVLMLDLDHFKSINDRFGHAVGDELLTAIGQTMLRTLRQSDVRCRWGGEEFLIVLPDTTLAQAQVVATHLLHNVAATAIASPKGPVASTASIGLTIARPAETDVNRVVARADMALYQAKHAGRACIRVVLGGFDGEPVGLEGPRKVAPAVNETLPFPDRRDQERTDRRKVPSPGRRRTDGDSPERVPRRNSEASFAARG